LNETDILVVFDEMQNVQIYVMKKDFVEKVLILHIVRVENKLLVVIIVQNNVNKIIN